MKKLWKVKVNNIGWYNPQTLYAGSREEAEDLAAKQDAADKVKYAGYFTDENADRLLGKGDNWE